MYPYLCLLTLCAASALSAAALESPHIPLPEDTEYAYTLVGEYEFELEKGIQGTAATVPAIRYAYDKQQREIERISVALTFNRSARYILGALLTDLLDRYKEIPDPQNMKGQFRVNPNGYGSHRVHVHFKQLAKTGLSANTYACDVQYTQPSGSPYVHHHILPEQQPGEATLSQKNQDFITNTLVNPFYYAPKPRSLSAYPGWFIKDYSKN